MSRHGLKVSETPRQWRHWIWDLQDPPKIWRMRVLSSEGWSNSSWALRHTCCMRSKVNIRNLWASSCLYLWKLATRSFQGQTTSPEWRRARVMWVCIAHSTQIWLGQTVHAAGTAWAAQGSCVSQALQHCIHIAGVPHVQSPAPSSCLFQLGSGSQISQVTKCTRKWDILGALVHSCRCLTTGIPRNSPKIVF